MIDVRIQKRDARDQRGGVGIDVERTLENRWKSKESGIMLDRENRVWI